MINFIVYNYFTHLMFQLETKEAGGDVLQKRLDDPVDVAPFKSLCIFLSVKIMSSIFCCLVFISGSV